MAKVLKEKILSVKRLAPSIFRMTIESAYVSGSAKPGQFVNIKCGEGMSPLLRRPVSICRVDREAETFDIVFQVKGMGTELLSMHTAGSTIDMIGPLGNPFTIPEKNSKIAVAGGGIGIFPLLFLLDEAVNTVKTAYLGFRSTEYAVMTEEFRKASDKLLIATDDGSLGYKGLVTDLLENDLSSEKPDIIYTCGPMPMLKKIVSLADQNSVRCQVSMEQRMGCGIGACLVCACKTKHGDDWQYSHVCKDGPVFWSRDLILDE